MEAREHDMAQTDGTGRVCDPTSSWRSCSIALSRLKSLIECQHVLDGDCLQYSLRSDGKRQEINRLSARSDRQARGATRVRSQQPMEGRL